MQPVVKLLRSGYKIFWRNYKTNVYLPQPPQHLPNKKKPTFLTRIAYYIDNEYNQNFGRALGSKYVGIPSPCVDLGKDGIKHFTDEELQGFLSNLKEWKLTLTQREFRNILDMIDQECIARLEYIDSGTILSILNALMKIGIEEITDYKFYELGINHLFKNVIFLNRQELLQMMFYVGLKKKMKDAQTILRNCVKELYKYDVSKLSIEELCIICNATFKTSTKITSKRLLANIHKILNDNLNILHDPALFTAFIKTIRHNREQSDDTLSTIACTILFNKTYEVYSFVTICHILALFADYAYYDEGLLNLLISSGIKEVSTLTNKVHLIRNKDITRFLWTLSALNVCEDTSYLNVILDIIKQKVQLGFYKNDIEELIEVILYLWILNHHAIGLIEYALTPENISYIKDQKSRTKLRLNLLLSCIYFESRELYKKMNLNVPSFNPYHTKLQLERRPHLVRVFEVLKKVSCDLPVNKFEITYEVPHLDICGVTGYSKKIYKLVYIEVLDDHVCVKNRESWPIGPMFLKLRILKSFDEALIVVDEDMAKNSTEEELKDYLIQEIQLLC